MLFLLGTGNIVMPETFEPTMLYMIVMLALGVIVHFIGSAIARLIGKDKRTAYWYIGLILVFSVLGIVMAGAEQPVPEGIPAPSMDMSVFVASFYAQRNSPMWLVYASPVASIIGVLLGGLSKGDVAKSAPSSPA
jgi:hypothetical protein